MARQLSLYGRERSQRLAAQQSPPLYASHEEEELGSSVGPVEAAPASLPSFQGKGKGKKRSAKTGEFATGSEAKKGKKKTTTGLFSQDGARIKRTRRSPDVRYLRGMALPIRIKVEKGELVPTDVEENQFKMVHHKKATYEKWVLTPGAVDYVEPPTSFADRSLPSSAAKSLTLYNAKGDRASILVRDMPSSEMGKTRGNTVVKRGNDAQKRTRAETKTTSSGRGKAPIMRALPLVSTQPPHLSPVVTLTDILAGDLRPVKEGEGMEVLRRSVRGLQDFKDTAMDCIKKVKLDKFASALELARNMEDQACGVLELAQALQAKHKEGVSVGAIVDSGEEDDEEGDEDEEDVQKEMDEDMETEGAQIEKARESLTIEIPSPFLTEPITALPKSPLLQKVQSPVLVPGSARSLAVEKVVNPSYSQPPQLSSEAREMSVQEEVRPPVQGPAIVNRYPYGHNPHQGTSKDPIPPPPSSQVQVRVTTQGFVTLPQRNTSSGGSVMHQQGLASMALTGPTPTGPTPTHLPYLTAALTGGPPPAPNARVAQAQDNFRPLIGSQSYRPDHPRGPIPASVTNVPAPPLYGFMPPTLELPYLPQLPPMGHAQTAPGPQLVAPMAVPRGYKEGALFLTQSDYASWIRRPANKLCYEPFMMVRIYNCTHIFLISRIIS